MFMNALSDILSLCFLMLYGDSGLGSNILFINVQNNSDGAKPDQAGALGTATSIHLPRVAGSQ